MNVKGVAEALTITEAQAAIVVGLIKGTVDPFSVAETAAWRNQCYHTPRADQAIMHAVNATIGAYGVEVIEGNWHDRYYMDIVAEYCNVGDAYTTTIVHNCVSGTYRVMAYGDFVERNERRYGIR